MAVEHWPELSAALADRAQLGDALERSLRWLESPASRKSFPVAGVSHARALASVRAFRRCLQHGDSAAVLAALRREFELYASVGSDGEGGVLFTGYYAPSFRGSRTRSDAYRHPLYARPQQLKADDVFAARAQIDADPGAVGLSGRELVYLADSFDAYIVHVNGSARIELPEGGAMHVGHDGTNNRPYTSIGKRLIADGKIAADRISLQEIRAYFAAHPNELDGYLKRNERYVFFRELADDAWPASALGIRLTPMRSIATDKSAFPPGCVTLVVTTTADTQALSRFMLDHDSGGAILSPGRVDLFMGIGDEAGEHAGRQLAAGRLYYFLLKD